MLTKEAGSFWGEAVKERVLQARGLKAGRLTVFEEVAGKKVCHGRGKSYQECSCTGLGKVYIFPGATKGEEAPGSRRERGGLAKVMKVAAELVLLDLKPSPPLLVGFVSVSATAPTHVFCFFHFPFISPHCGFYLPQDHQPSPSHSLLLQ